jgi:zinc protease
MTIGLKRGLSPAKTTLANGSVLLVQPTAMAPAVTIDCSFAAGSLFDPVDLPGVGQMVGRVLDRGTLRRTANVIAEELDERGVALRVTTTRHGLSVSCTCLSEDFPAVLPILLDVARRPAFPECEIEQPRAETITALKQDDDNPAVRAVDSVAELIYGADHPYARKAKGNIAAVERMGRADFVAFHERWVRPSTLVLAVVGDVDSAAALELAAQELEDWSAPMAEHVPVPAPPAATSRRVARVEMPGKAQADIAYGFNTIRRLDPRYYAYWMMNNVLGQFGLGGRLADNIRERQGMAYYIYSTFDPSVGEGPLLVRAGVDPVNVSRTIDAIDEEVRRLAAGPTPAEVSETCEYLVGSIPRFLETNYGIAAFLQTVERYGLGADYDQRLPGLIRSVTIDEVRAAAAEVLNPDLASVAVAGPIAPEFNLSRV